MSEQADTRRGRAQQSTKGPDPVALAHSASQALSAGDVMVPFVAGSLSDLLAVLREVPTDRLALVGYVGDDGDCKVLTAGDLRRA